MGPGRPRPPETRPPSTRGAGPARGSWSAIAAFLPLTDATPRLSLGEGATPLVRAERLGAAWGLRNLLPQVRGREPDRLLQGPRAWSWPWRRPSRRGARSIVCASTGNTSASAAAYGAAAGLEVVVVLPAGKIAAGKLLQAQAAGARVLAVHGNFDAALAAVRELAEQDDAPDHPRQLGEPVPPRGPEDGRLRGLRRPRRAARRPGHPGRQRRATSAPTGWASGPTARPASSTACPACGASRPPARRRSCSATRSSTRRRSRPRSASATRRRGRRRRPPATSRAG